METAADALTVVTGAIAFWVVLVSLSWPARHIIMFRLTLTKVLTVGKELRKNDLSPTSQPLSWLAIWRSIHARVRRRIQAEPISVADELNWVSAQMNRLHNVTFASDDALEAVTRLAHAYRLLSSRLTVRLLVAGGNQPVIDAEAQTAHDTAEQLFSHTRRAIIFADLSPSNPDSGPSTWSSTSGSGDSQATITLVGMGPETPYEAHDLAVSSRRMRVIVDSETSKARALADGSEPWILPPSTDNSQITEQLTRQPHLYDGILPALLGYRSEKGTRTGERQLHLSVAEISYSAHKVLSTSRQSSSTHAEFPRLLTLSMVPITKDGFLVMVRRSMTNAFYPNAWAPGVNGNLDMPDPLSDYGDAAPTGFPDPIKALCREAVEELGVTVDPDHVHVHGLARVDNAAEHGTWVLLTTCHVSLTLEEMIQQTMYSNPVEGRWEIGTSLLALERPRSTTSANNLLEWAWSNAEVMPHLTAVLTGYCTAEGFTAQADWSWNHAEGLLPENSQIIPFG